MQSFFSPVLRCDVRWFVVVLYLWLLAETLVLMRMWHRSPTPNILNEVYPSPSKVLDYTGSLWAAWSDLQGGKGLRFTDVCRRHYDQGRLKSTRTVKRQEVTLVIHSDSSKLDRLRFVIQRWNGLVSAFVYVGSALDLERVLDFCRAEPSLPDSAFIHVYMEKQQHDSSSAGGVVLSTIEYYPHNTLAQLALDYSTTNYFLALNVDFVTPTTLSQYLIKLLRTNESTLVRKSINRKLMLLPAFQTSTVIQDSQLQPGTAPLNEVLPENKAFVHAFLRKGKLVPFHQASQTMPVDHHVPTNFDKWLIDVGVQESTSGTSLSYPIDYTMGFEPSAVLGYRSKALPKYWNNFRGLGYNTWTWIAETYLTGYDLEVMMCDVCFVTHLPLHPQGIGQTKMQPPPQQKIYEQWKGYLQSHFGLTDLAMDWMLLDLSNLKNAHVQGPPNGGRSSSSSEIEKLPRLVDWTVWKGRVVGRIFHTGHTSASYYVDGEWIGTAAIVVPDETAEVFVLKSGMTVASTSGQRYYLSNTTLRQLSKEVA